MRSELSKSIDNGGVASSLHAILAIFVDVVVGLGLVLLAFYLTGLLGRWTPFAYPSLDIVWFLGSMIPFAIYAHLRGVLEFTWQFNVRLLIVLIVFPFVPMHVPDGLGGELIYSLVFVVALFSIDWILAAVIPHYRSETREHKQDAA